MNKENRNQTIKFLTAQTVSLLGSSLVQYAIIWTITLRTSSGFMMSMATLCGYLPQIFISLFAGVWIDRYSRKLMIMIPDALIALSTLLVAILYISGYQEIWLLFVVLIIRSIGTGIQTPAVNAFLPEIVDKDQLMKVNGLNSTLTSLIMFISPALSGLILSLTTIEYAFFIDVVTAIIGVGVMFGVHAKQSLNETKKETMVTNIKQGFDYLKTNPTILSHLFFFMIIMLLISPAAFFTPLLVSRTFGAELWRLSFSEMSFSIGAILGGFLITTWGGFKNRNFTIVLATTIYGLMMVGIGFSTTFITYILFNTLVGITLPCCSAPSNVLLQEEVEPQMLGRVFSILQIASSCSLPLGSALFGPLGDIVPIQLIILTCGGFVVLTSAIRFIVIKKTAK